MERGKVRVSIKTRLIVTFAGLTLLVLGLTGVLLYRTTRASLEAEVGRKLLAIARIAAESIPVDLTLRLQKRMLENGGLAELPRTYVSNREKLINLVSTTGVSRIYIFDRQYRSLADSYLGAPMGMPYPNVEFFLHEVKLALSGKPTLTPLFRGTDKGYFKSCYLPVIKNGEVQAIVCVEAKANFLEELNNLGRRITLTGLVGVLLTIIAAFILSHSIVTPINRLVEASERIGKGNLRQPITVKGVGEVEFLAKTMETMRQKINRRDEELMAMLAGVAHEIRNPLGGIEIFTGLLADELKPDSEQRELLAKISNEVQNLKQIVKQFIDFAYPLKTRKEKLKIAGIMDEILPSLEPKINSNGIRMTVSGDGDLAVKADREQLKRALENIVLNAVQAMPRGGDLEINWGRNGKEVFIAVKDTGNGIPPDLQRKIYNPFFTTKERGCGLGLAITKKIVEGNGGRIEVESEPGKGSTFTIRFPGPGKDERKTGGKR